MLLIITKTYSTQWLNDQLNLFFKVSKLFSNLLNKDKDNTSSSSVNVPDKQESEKSKPLIILGFIISLSSIFLLLFTINNKFG